MSDKAKMDMTAFLSDVGKCEFVSPSSIEVIFKTMEAYFAGRQGYESCLEKLKDSLEIYLSE